MLPAGGGETKNDFAVDSPFRLKPLVTDATSGLQIDNALDISCNKLSALFDRAEAKDFADVYFIIKELYPWPVLLEKAGVKHVGLDPQFLAKAFLRVRDLRTLPRMTKPLDLQTLQDFFLPLARQLMDQLKS